MSQTLLPSDTKFGRSCFDLIDKTSTPPQMLHATTLSSLVRGLGSYNFVESIHATHRSDLTSAAYGAHVTSNALPPPMTSQEKEESNAKAMEREFTDGSRGRRIDYLGTGVGLKWTDQAQEAVIALSEAERSTAVILVIDDQENLILQISTIVEPDDLKTIIAADMPCITQRALQR